jgi:H+-transporting ATPase
VAASVILVLTLSILLFATGCAVKSLLVIILALLNDVSLIPVAYDRAQATAKPQLPRAFKLVTMSLYYGLTHSAFGLMFLFLMDHKGESSLLAGPLEFDVCPEENQGFVWFHLVLVTELMIFSVRSPSFMLLSRPSWALLASVLGTCVIAAFVAVYASDLSGYHLLWIVLYNIAALLFVDAGKIGVRHLIDDDPGDVIDDDKLKSLPEQSRTDDEKKEAKDKRYRVHQASVMSVEELTHAMHIHDKARSTLAAFFHRHPVSTGFVNPTHERKQYHAMQREQSSRKQQKSSLW